MVLSKSDKEEHKRLDIPDTLHIIEQTVEEVNREELLKGAVRLTL